MKKSIRAVLTAGAILPLAVFTLSEAVASKGNAKGEKDYLLILGHALKGNEASDVLKMRCAKAAEYLTEHKNTVAIACGGITGKSQTKSEAEVIKELLISNGIDEKRIILEDKSKTTAENFYNAKKIMGDTKGRTALLSSSYHLLRASAIAKSCGIEAQTVAAYTPGSEFLRCYAKEFFAFPLIFWNTKGAEKNG